MIRFTNEHLQQIRNHGETTYPEECGGLLLGLVEGQNKLVAEVLSLANRRSYSRHNRVELSPIDYMRAEKRADANGLEILGFYHSHPDHPAVPSAYDLEHAPMLDWSYVIVTVAAGGAGVVRSWSLRPGRESFVEEEIELQ